jgi:SnoaL-like domain
MSAAQDIETVARWSVGGVFLEALATRDYELMGTTLAPAVRLRAMLPPGPMDWEGPDEVAAVFSSWFGDAEDFELIDATVGEVGGRLHLSWRLRVRPAPFGIGEGWHVIEQQAYADAASAIESLDLLCSGFHPDRTNERPDRQGRTATNA